MCKSVLMCFYLKSVYSTLHTAVYGVILEASLIYVERGKRPVVCVYGKVTSLGDVFCQSYEMEWSERIPSRDRTCSAGVASNNVRLSDEMLAVVRQWLEDAECQLSAAAVAKMNADNEVTHHNVQPLFNGL